MPKQKKQSSSPQSMLDASTDPFLASYVPRQCGGKKEQAPLSCDLSAAFAAYSMSNNTTKTSKQDAVAIEPLEGPFDRQQAYNGGKEYPFPVISVNDSYKQSPPHFIKKNILTIATPIRNKLLQDPQSTPSTPPLTPACLSSPSESIRSLPTPSDSDAFPFISLPEVDSVDKRSTDEDEGAGPECTLSEQILSRHALHPAFSAQYLITCELGTGGFGFVVKASRIRDGMDVAVKFIFKNSMPSHTWVRDQQWNQGVRPIPSEAQMLMAIKHSGVVSFVDLFEDDAYFYLVMQHHGSPWADQKETKQPVVKSSPGMCTKSGNPTVEVGTPTPSPSSLPLPRPMPAIRRSSCDLFECIESRSKLTENEARYVFAQVVSVVFYLQAHNIYHMDIKDENLVIDAKLKVKLIDFGSAVRCLPNRVFQQFYGTVAYACPEILQNQLYQAPSSEIWSLGILFSILLTGESIYRDPEAVLANDYNKEAFEALSPECQHILHLCLQFDPHARASIAELRAHPWLAPTIKQLERQARS